MDKKKQIERIQLEKFVSNENLKFLVYDIENSETPDFIVNIDKKIISIEHTRLINPQLQEEENYRDRIIKNAQLRFEEKYKEKIYTLLTFKETKLLGGKDYEKIYTDEVYSLIEKIYLDNSKFEFRISSKRSREFVSDTIKSFSVDNTRNFSHWQHFGAYLVEWIDMNWLTSVIDKKGKNIKKYSKEFDENWLLLVSDFGTKASANRTDFIDFSIIKSDFDKIYLYSYRADEVHQIK
jgi:hypothetical protein